MWRGLFGAAAALALTCAAYSAWAQASAAPGTIFRAAPVTGVTLARAARQQWTWPLEPGTYLAVARVNFRLRALGSSTADARLQCSLTDNAGNVDIANAVVLPDAKTSTGLFADTSDDGVFTLTTMVQPASGITVWCRNNGVSPAAVPITIDSITLTAMKGYNLQALPAPTVR